MLKIRHTTRPQPDFFSQLYFLLQILWICSYPCNDIVTFAIYFCIYSEIKKTWYLPLCDKFGNIVLAEMGLSLICGTQIDDEVNHH